MGCGPQETFRACADIAIGESDPDNSFNQIFAQTKKTPVQVPQFLNQKFTAVPESVHQSNLNNKKSFTLPIITNEIKRKKPDYVESVNENTLPSVTVRKEIKRRRPVKKDSKDNVSKVLDNLIDSIESCEAVGVYKGVPGMSQWCNLNCNHVPRNCPPTHCSCL